MYCVKNITLVLSWNQCLVPKGTMGFLPALSGSTLEKSVSHFLKGFLKKTQVQWRESLLNVFSSLRGCNLKVYPYSITIVKLSLPKTETSAKSWSFFFLSLRSGSTNYLGLIWQISPSVVSLWSPWRNPRGGWASRILSVMAGDFKGKILS